MDAYILAVKLQVAGNILSWFFSRFPSDVTTSHPMHVFFCYFPPKQSNLLFLLIAALVGLWISLTSCFNW